jgi:hypothetical protein
MDNRWVHSPSLFTGICGLLFYLYLWILVSVIFLVESDILKFFRINPSLGYVLCINKFYVSFPTLFSYSVYILCMFHSQLCFGIVHVVLVLVFLNFLQILQSYANVSLCFLCYLWLYRLFVCKNEKAEKRYN